MTDSLKDINLEIEFCIRCPLYHRRIQPVYGMYPETTKSLLFIYDGPHAAEDVTGKPLVGKSGTEFSNVVYEQMGLLRKDYSVTSCIKCIPIYKGKVREEPKADSLFWCAEYMYREIELMKPKLVISLGAIPLRILLSRNNAMKFHKNDDVAIGPNCGKLFKVKSLLSEFEFLVYPTYHPLAWGISRKLRKIGKVHLKEASEILNAIETGKDIPNVLGFNDLVQQDIKQRARERRSRLSSK